MTIMQTADTVGLGVVGGGGGRLLCKCEISSAMVEGGGWVGVFLSRECRR